VQQRGEAPTQLTWSMQKLHLVLRTSLVIHRDNHFVGLPVLAGGLLRLPREPVSTAKAVLIVGRWTPNVINQQCANTEDKQQIIHTYKHTGS